MKEQSVTKKELLSTVERRFQFVVVLGLFLPFIADNLLQISPDLSKVLGGSWVSFNYTIISAIFISYLLIEIFRKTIKENFLQWIAGALIALSYTLIVVIGFASTAKGVELSGWKLVLFDISVLGNIFIPILILVLPIASLINDGIRFITKKVNL